MVERQLGDASKNPIKIQEVIQSVEVTLADGQKVSLEPGDNIIGNVIIKGSTPLPTSTDNPKEGEYFLNVEMLQYYNIWADTLKELRKINLQLSLLTDVEIKTMDVD